MKHNLDQLLSLASKFETLAKDKKSSNILDTIQSFGSKYDDMTTDLFLSVEDLEEKIKDCRSKLHKLIKIKDEFNFKGGPPSERSKINKMISSIGDEILGLELQLEENKEKFNQRRELEEASPMGRYDSPSDYYASGAADDKKL